MYSDDNFEQDLRVLEQAAQDAFHRVEDMKSSKMGEIIIDGNDFMDWFMIKYKDMDVEIPDTWLKLAAMPPQRHLEFKDHVTDTWGNIRGTRMEALLLTVVGNAIDCGACTNRGIFKTCCSLPGIVNGACNNCYLNGVGIDSELRLGSACPHYNAQTASNDGSTSEALWLAKKLLFEQGNPGF